MSIMYGDYLKDKFRKIGINFDIVEKEMPPFANKQRWFLIEESKQILSEEEDFEMWLGKLIHEEIKFENKKLFLCVRESEYVEGRIGGELIGIYFFDFNLPIEKVKDKFLTKGWTAVRKKPGRCFLVNDFFLYNVPIVSGTEEKTNPNSLKKTIKEGHYITFKMIPSIDIERIKEGTRVEEISFNYRLIPSEVDFYYENGIIKFPYEPEKLDNIFLIKMIDIIKLIGKISAELKVKSKISNFCKDLLEKLTNELFIYIYTLSGSKVEEKYYDVQIKFSIPKLYVHTKNEFMQSIDKICKTFIESFLGEALEPTEDIDEKIKQLENNLKIVEEILTLVI